VDVTITVGTKVAVSAPYAPSFVDKARKIGGSFDRPAKVWEFDPRSEQAARDLCKQVYGSDGSDNDQPRVTIRIPLDGPNVKEFRPAGEALVWRRYRDEPVRFAPHVVLVAGDFPSRGGSVANPRLDPDDGTVIEVRDLPPGTAQKITDDWGTAEIVAAPPADDAAARINALHKERDSLAARITQIDAELAQMTGKADA